MPPLNTPLADSKFNLNSAGVAGFFGGEEAISAMATVHLYEGRRWLGWYNSPGSYPVAKRFGRMANGRFWDGLFPGSNDSPALTFGLDGQKGPQYIAALSGTTMNAGHLAYLTMERIKELDEEEIEGRRSTSTFDVAYLAMNEVDLNVPIKLEPFLNSLLGLLPIIVSVAACVACALVFDWLSFSMTFLGIISSGLASLVIGEGKLSINSVKPAKGAPPGHGLLVGENEMVVIKGREQDVNVITKGHFYLKTGSGHYVWKKGGKEKDSKKCDEKRNGTNGDLEKSKTETGEKKKKCTENYHMIGVSSLFLLLQFLLQLLLVPQGTLFGQVMFLVSLGASWAYNSYLSSLEKEKTQTEILWRVIKPQEMLRFRTGTRTTMAVFVCLLVFHGVPRSSSIEEDREYRLRILNQCVPNETAVWKRWREKVVAQLLSVDDGSESLPHLKEDEEDRSGKIPESCKPLLQTLLSDAEAAFIGYFRVRRGLPVDSTHLKVKDQANFPTS